MSKRKVENYLSSLNQEEESKGDIQIEEERDNEEVNSDEESEGLSSISKESDYFEDKVNY